MSEQIWNQETDVVVLGAGGAGLAAAIGAAQEGCAAIVVEALDSVWKSNTATCGGVMMAACTSVQREAGIEDSVAEFEKYLEAVGGGYDDPALRKLWANLSGPTLEWVRGLGVNFPQSHLYVSGVEPMFAHITPPVARGHITDTRSGRPIVEALYKKAQACGVTWMFETRGQRLITGSGGEVQGVEVEQNGQRLTLRARRGVVLATAGFSRNTDMIKNFMPKMLTGGSFGSEWQQGDGIKMGQAVGARLVNMWVPQAAVFGVPVSSHMTPCMVVTIWGGACVMVGQDGKRHFNEDMYYEFLYDRIAELPGGFVWTIWDQDIADLGSQRIVVPPFEGGLDAAVANGWVHRADTVADLAGPLGLDPQTLTQTLDEYNAAVRAGQDPLGKVVGLGAVARPPFYGVKTVPAICDTAGGLQVNTAMQVINVFGQPIPRLYAAGSTTGGWRGKIYPGSGTAVTVAIALGRVAGQAVSAESPQA